MNLKIWHEVWGARSLSCWCWVILAFQPNIPWWGHYIQPLVTILSHTGSSACPCHSSSVFSRVEWHSPFPTLFCQPECLGSGLNITCLHQPVVLGSKLPVFEISSPSWFPFTLAFVCSGRCHSVQKVASPRESDLELNPPLAVLIHTSQCWQPSSPDTFRHILEKYLFV